MSSALTKLQLDTINRWLERAERRLAGAAAAAKRPHPSEGEFDNNFDGVVTAIFHTVDAFELARTHVHRRMGDGEEAVMIRSVVLALMRDHIAGVPSPERLINLNYRRNTSVHGSEWAEVLDPEALEEAITAARGLLIAVKLWLTRQGIRF